MRFSEHCPLCCLAFSLFRLSSEGSLGSLADREDLVAVDFRHRKWVSKPKLLWQAQGGVSGEGVLIAQRTLQLCFPLATVSTVCSGRDSFEVYLTVGVLVSAP